MLRCCLCAAELADHDGYIRGAISGEIMQPGPRATGQKNAWEGLAFCLSHFEAIPRNISENLALIAKQKRLDDNQL